MMKYLILFLVINFFSCSDLKVIPALKEAYVSSVYPDVNFNGKKEADKGEGFGSKKKILNNYITYPALYLINGEEEKASFVLGGFDLTGFTKRISHASLKFYINYSSADRKRVTIFVRPVLKSWDEDKLSFNDIYTFSEGSYVLTDFTEKSDSLCKIIVFNINKNDYDLNVIPFKGSYKTVSVDVTDIINRFIDRKELFYGFLIEPMNMEDFRYITTNFYNVISDTGIIEVASGIWFNWNGKIPETFYIKNNSWINVKNRAFKKIEYVPRLEVTK